MDRLKISPEHRSLLEELIIASDNIILNFHILSEKEFFVQALNSLDRYFGNYNTDGVKFNEDYYVEEYNLAGTRSIGLVTGRIEIKPQDIKLFKVILA